MITHLVSAVNKVQNHTQDGMMKKIVATMFIVVASLFMVSCNSSDEDDINDCTIDFTFPGEWEKHEGTWLIWPHNYGIIAPEYVEMIDEVWVTIAKALHTGERVHIIAYDNEERKRIGTLLEEAGVDMSQVDFLLAETDQFWARDYGPIFAKDSEGKPAILDWGYNGYGRMDKLVPDVPEHLRWEMPDFAREEYLENYVKDDALAQRVANTIGIRSVKLNGFVFEGGAIESDGYGTIITTESCMLNENRNPGISRTEAEVYFKKYLGATNVIWLEGSPDEEITDGHIDGLVRFVDANTIVTMTEADYHGVYDYTPEGDYDKVINARNAKGQKYNIVTLPITAEEIEWLGLRANYLNYYAGNEVVLVPVYGDVMDGEALRILGGLYPEKEIVPVDGEILAMLGGGIHCVTQQQTIF